MKVVAGTYLVKTIGKTGKEYVALYYDVGWRRIYITIKIAEISDILDMKIRELKEYIEEMELNEPIKVA